MSYRIKELFDGRQLTGFDSAHVEIKDISNERRSFTICASSDRPDRFKDIVVQEGLDWSSWMRNPICPWAHDYRTIPVAKGTGEPWIEKDGEYTKSFIRMQMGSHYEAEQIFSAIQEGLIKSASIGFLPRKSEKIKLEEGEEAPMFHEPSKFLKAEILEVSLVSLPANPDATMAMKSMVSNGRLPPFVMENYASLSPEAEFELDSIAREHRLDAILESLNGDDDLEDDDDLEGATMAELDALVKMAVRSALGRLD